MEGYTLQESPSHIPRSVQAGPSYTHPRRRRFVEDSDSFVTTQGTQQDAEDRYGSLSGGAGSKNGDDGESNGVPESPRPPNSAGPPNPPGPPNPSGPPGPPGPTLPAR